MLIKLLMKVKLLRKLSAVKSEIDYIGIPAVVFSDPELATVGYTEQEAKEEGIEVIAAKFPFAANGRALSLNNTDGFLKLITRKEDGLVIGAKSPVQMLLI